MKRLIVEDENYEGILGTCKDCQSNVASYLCNDSLIKFRPEAYYEDYWMSCTNEVCKNHYGEGYLQFTPEWFMYN